MAKFNTGDNATYIISVFGDARAINKDLLAQTDDHQVEDTFAYFSCGHVAVTQSLVTALRALGVKVTVYKKIEVTHEF